MEHISFMNTKQSNLPGGPISPLNPGKPRSPFAPSLPFRPGVPLFEQIEINTFTHDKRIH